MPRLNFQNIFPASGTADAHKRYLRGTQRSIPPEQTLARIEPLLKDFGITRAANVTGLDRIGVPVYMVMRPNARSVSVSAGKGLEPLAAKVSGIMEAIELFHGEHIDLPVKFASYEEMAVNHRLADPANLPRPVSSRFTMAMPILWIEAMEIHADACQWLPLELVSANYALPALPGSGSFLATTNGLASGNNLLEAVCHGICEVVERDASTLFENRSADDRNARRLDLERIEDSDARQLLHQLDAAGFTTAVWDITSDIGVPCFHSLIVDDREPLSHRGTGSGCHPVKEVALSRTLTEAIQVRGTYISGGRDDIERFDYDTAQLSAMQWLTRREIEAPPSAKRNFSDIPLFEAATFLDDIEWLAERLRRVGLDEIFIADLTKPAYDLAVVRVVVPGLEAPAHGNDVVPGARLATLRGAG